MSAPIDVDRVRALVRELWPVTATPVGPSGRSRGGKAKALAVCDEIERRTGMRVSGFYVLDVVETDRLAQTRLSKPERALELVLDGIRSGVLPLEATKVRIQEALNFAKGKG